jgi:nitrogen fixation/metabolism regulation signal transduction histidine kinase
MLSVQQIKQLLSEQIFATSMDPAHYINSSNQAKITSISPTYLGSVIINIVKNNNQAIIAMAYTLQ